MVVPLDWWALLLPAAFLVGWWAGRIDMGMVVTQARRSPQRMLNGLIYLLAGEREKAADEFQAGTKDSDEDKPKLLFAAGQLRRDLGDYEQAIKIHKSLQNTEPGDQADSEIQARARFELGLDFYKGGFFDLAEQCFRKLENTSYAAHSCEHLFKIHFRERAWEQAIKDHQVLARSDDNPEFRRHILAHLYCEWASENPPTAGRRVELIAAARKVDPTCVRAILLESDFALAEDRSAAALTLLNPLLGRAELLPLIVVRILTAHRLAGTQAQGIELLRELLRTHPSPQLFSSICSALEQTNGIQQVDDLARVSLKTIGGRQVAIRWLEAALRTAEDAAARGNYENLIIALRAVEYNYQCANCSYRAHEHAWQCPLCSEWEAFMPVAMAEGR